MRITHYLPVALMLLASLAAGQELKLDVQAPEQVDEHTICIVQVSTNAKFTALKVRRTLFDGVDCYQLASDGTESQRWAWTAAPGTYGVEVQVYDPELGLHSKLLKVVVGKVKPDPDPDPDPTPVPPEPTDAPFPAPGLSVVIVAEQGEIGNLPAGQRAIFSDGALRAWLASVTSGRSRIWDDDLDDLGNAPKVMQDGYAVAKRDMDGPWIAISNGKAGVSQKLPATVDELKALVQRFQ